MISVEQHNRNWKEALDAGYAEHRDMLRAVSRDDAPELWKEGDLLRASYLARKGHVGA